MWPAFHIEVLTCTLINYPFHLGFPEHNILCVTDINCIFGEQMGVSASKTQLDIHFKPGSMEQCRMPPEHAVIYQ